MPEKAFLSPSAKFITKECDERDTNENIASNGEISTEELDALALDNLQSALNNRTIKNSDGADVTVRVVREKMTRTDEEMWYVTFDFEYNGRLINRRYPQTDNFIPPKYPVP